MFVPAAGLTRRLVHHANFLSIQNKLPILLPYTRNRRVFLEVWQAAGTVPSQISLGNAEHYNI